MLFFAGKKNRRKRLSRGRVEGVRLPGHNLKIIDDSPTEINDDFIVSVIITYHFFFIHFFLL